MKFIKKDKSLWVLLFANLFPIIGVLFLNWDYLNVILLYIFETVIVGFFNVPKMILAEKYVEKINLRTYDFSSPDAFQSKDGKTYPGCLKIFLIPFFLVHYNGFVVVQTVFVYFIATETGKELRFQDFLTFDYIVSIIFIIASHGYSFKKNYIDKKEYKKSYAPKQMFTPYKRIIIQQATVLIGSFLIFFFEAPMC